MTNTINVAGSLLTADADSRVLTYRLLPYGEAGSTNVGKVTASQGSVTVPDDVSTVGLNLEHDYKRPLGRAVSITEDTDGLTAAFRIAHTRAGDDLLEEAAEGLRAAVSVEITDPVIRAGALVSGRLTGAGAVVRPAYPSALLVAEDFGDLQEALDAVQEALDALTNADAPDEPVAEETETTDTVSADNEKETQMDLTAAVPAELNAAKGGSGSAASHLYATLASIPRTTSHTLLAAALDEITQTDVFDVVNPPAYAGELWLGRGYAQRFAPLVGSAPLTGTSIKGWRFVSGKTPTVGDYAGFPADVPTNEVDTEEVTITAARIAGGHALDRIHTDLPDAGFWAGYLRESTDSYARQIDGKVITHLSASATAVTAVGTNVLAAGGWGKVAYGAQQLLEFAVPTYAVVGADLWLEMALVEEQDRLAFLNASLGLEEGSLASFKVVGAPVSNTALNGKVIVGAAGATTLYQLAGGPVRVNALDIQRGGVDHGVFGYYALHTSDARGVIKVS